ncbi:MAG: cysteine--tRNA ligase [Acidimicrobiales bacterium]|nr:cysteine--tRNA ligase [Acidimicrobiaceae bacterium]MBT6092937.1 cysteine--tRNA ligase [Acidimicrobiaceae bacterium]MDG2161460.1 cysteine--tRNA ligase [Acidimicrobiales bacterium]
MLRFTDSLTGKKVEFTPRDPGKASVYWCGPTVYDDPHLGHARSTLAFDVLVRYLRWSDYDVCAVSNITDIDDKIINRAAAEGGSEPEVAGRYEASFIGQMDRLNVAHPDLRPRATEYVDKMVEIIADLVDREMAYTTDSGVYFDVDRLDDYGALVGRSVEDLREGAGARVEVDDDKNDPLDFALWKAAKPGEPTWDSPWGPGRPGWHIECVAMSLHLLGDGFDIHGGGDDLVFPHHENERAEALGCGRAFARHWVHNAMVQVDGEKMSKSLGNFTTLDDLLNTWDPRALRLLVLQTHYRRTMEVGSTTLDQSAAALARLDKFADRMAGSDLPEAEPDADVVTRFRTAMDDDLGSPQALAVIFDAVRDANRALDAEDDSTAAELHAAAIELAGVLGLELGSAAAPARDVQDDAEAAEIDDLVDQRVAAKAAKNYDKADRIRDKLTARGIILEDSARGTSWHRG